MLVREHEATPQRLLQQLLFRLVVPVGTICDDGPHTREAQAIRVAKVPALQEPCHVIVRSGYQLVYPAQNLVSLASLVLGSRRFSNRRRGRCWWDSADMTWTGFRHPGTGTGLSSLGGQQPWPPGGRHSGSGSGFPTPFELLPAGLAALGATLYVRRLDRKCWSSS